LSIKASMRGWQEDGGLQIAYFAKKGQIRGCSERSNSKIRGDIRKNRDTERWGVEKKSVEIMTSAKEKIEEACGRGKGGGTGQLKFPATAHKGQGKIETKEGQLLGEALT